MSVTSNGTEMSSYEVSPHYDGTYSNISCGNENYTLVLVLANGSASEIESSPYGSVICMNGLWYTIPSTGNISDGSATDLQPLLSTNHFECQAPLCLEVNIGITSIFNLTKFLFNLHEKL